MHVHTLTCAHMYMYVYVSNQMEISSFLGTSVSAPLACKDLRDKDYTKIVARLHSARARCLV